MLEFDELQKQLRAGKHGAPLSTKLRPGEVQVQVTSEQRYAVRRKEEWKALERFDDLLDANGDGTRHPYPHGTPASPWW